MRKFFALIVISLSLAVLEVDSKKMLTEPVPIVYQLDRIPQSRSGQYAVQYFNYSFDRN